MVARFLRGENILSGTARRGPDVGTILQFAGHEIRIAEAHEGDVTFMARPELLRVHPQGDKVENAVVAELSDVADRGVYRRLEFDAGIPLVAFVPGEHEGHTFTPGQRYAVVIPPSAVRILED